MGTLNSLCLHGNVSTCIYNELLDFHNRTCADPEGGTGGPDPPENFT